MCSVRSMDILGTGYFSLSVFTTVNEFSWGGTCKAEISMKLFYNHNQDIIRAGGNEQENKQKPKAS